MRKHNVGLGAVALLLAAGAARAAPPADPSSTWTLQDENASISTANLTDRYYVNGLRLGWTSPTGAVPGFLATLGNTLWGDGQQRIGFSLSQQMYTPADTQVSVPDPHDRPYAGLLLGNFSLLSDTDTSRSVLMLSLGWTGPASGAEALQNGFHSLIGQSKDNGWSHQIDNTAAFEVLSGRTWRLPLAQFGGVRPGGEEQHDRKRISRPKDDLQGGVPLDHQFQAPLPGDLIHRPGWAPAHLLLPDGLHQALACELAQLRIQRPAGDPAPDLGIRQLGGPADLVAMHRSALGQQAKDHETT